MTLTGRRWFRVARWAALSAVWILGVVASVYGIWGAPWPVDPEIHPEGASVNSSLDLRFHITSSGLLPIHNAQMTCGIDLVWFEDALGQSAQIRDVAFVTGTYSIPVSYPCNASALLQVRPDRTLTLGGSDTVFAYQDGTPIKWYPPFKIIKACVWVGGVYWIGGLIPWSFYSEIDQWPRSPTNHSWIEGPVAPPLVGQNPFGDLPWPQHSFGLGTPIAIDRYPLLNALNCNQTIRYPLGLVSGIGRIIFVPSPRLSWADQIWYALKYGPQKQIRRR